MAGNPRRQGLRLAAAFVLIASAAAGASLFPQPIHLVRTIEEPIGRTKVTIEEYCAGNRIVSVRGDRVSIIDFGPASDLTEIDRSAGTWSRTPFAALAAAQRVAARRMAATQNVRENGTRPSASGRALELFEAVDADASMTRRIEVAVDRQVPLSREALEALIGAAYPASHSDVADVVLAAAADHRASAAAARANAPLFGLPAEVSVSVTMDGESLITRNTIVTLDGRTVPPELLLIPDGSTRVESPLVRFAKEAEALDHPAGAHR